MFKWEEIELRLAVLQILREVHLKRDEKADEPIPSNIHPQSREPYATFRKEVSAADHKVTVSQFSQILRVEEKKVNDACKSLINDEMISESAKGFSIEEKGISHLIDILTNGLSE